MNSFSQLSTLDSRLSLSLTPLHSLVSLLSITYFRPKEALLPLTYWSEMIIGSQTLQYTKHIKHDFNINYTFFLLFLHSLSSLRVTSDYWIIAYPRLFLLFFHSQKKCYTIIKQRARHKNNTAVLFFTSLSLYPSVSPSLPLATSQTPAQSSAGLPSQYSWSADPPACLQSPPIAPPLLAPPHPV